MLVETERRRDAHTSDGTTPRNEVVMLFDSTLPLRFWHKVYADPSGCWLWVASLNTPGYGQSWNGKKVDFAHRMSYAAFKGAIPSDLELDHLCRVRRCVNPLHLEAVTHGENMTRGQIGKGLKEWNQRRTHCKHGHEFTEENTHHYQGKRICRVCRLDYLRSWRARQAS